MITTLNYSFDKVDFAWMLDRLDLLGPTDAIHPSNSFGGNYLGRCFIYVWLNGVIYEDERT